MSQHLLVLLPLLLPLYGAILCLPFWKRSLPQQWVAGCTQVCWMASAAMLIYEVTTTGIVKTQIGNWPAPYGITMVADIFSALMIGASTIVGFAVYLFSLRGLNESRKTYGYYPMLLLLQMGISGVCLTGDIFNLYVWFEVLLISCFTLLALGGTKAQLEGTIKYVTINMLASGLLLTGIGMVYSLTGSLNLAELGRLVRQPGSDLSLVNIASIFFLIGFGIKSAIFPLFFWLPASYHTPPIAISAFIAGLLTKVGIYTLIRLFTLVFIMDRNFILPLLLVLSGLTMVVGVLGAASQTDFRKILSFHIVSQIGYMLMGLAINTPLAIAGSVFFILHNILVKTNLFLISGVVAQRHKTFALKKLGGEYLKNPFLAILFLLSALSLAGIPPFSGFWGKFMLAKAGLLNENYSIVATSLAVSLITIFSMTKIWNEAFLKPKPDNNGSEKEVVTSEEKQASRYLLVPVVLLAGIILFIGLYAEPVISLSIRAAEQLKNTDLYINAVLNR
ncbi:proton-conducting transporter membrane subunit [Pontibacter silvestris]|uniref:Proton-conducting transporter membrane subunit n=1 Tax=Pontibacter silvestris TaxID=2305183 RepID=A0ABW4WXT1_9BACT|nr:proton-conducting transporter membrane subunit [Pontibacter silvestris]MCC9135319.1 Na+/H+ antiporter subunit D [Pontibacter silvestris]